MKLFKLFLLSAMLVAGLSLTGCNEEPITSVTPDANPTGLAKFTLPAGGSLVSATLNLYKIQGRPRDINVHEVNVAWDESETYNSFYANPDPEFNAIPFHTFNGGLAGFEISFDVTAQVAAWLADPTTNFGVLLDEAGPTPASLFELVSREGGVNGPHLIINYLDGNNDPQQATEYASLDTYISSLTPDASFGSDGELVTAKPAEFVKQALIWFDLDMEPPVVEECETAYAFGGAAATCISTLPNVSNWGWTNYITGPGTWEYPIYAAAGQCDITKGTLVGTLEVDYDGTTVTVEYVIDSDFTLDETHLWIGTTQLPIKNGKFTSAPGSFNYNGQNPVSVDIAAPFYIAAHSVVCGDYSN